MTTQATDRYAVVGHPISHSRSPWIHQEFAKATHQVLEYDRYDVSAADLTSFLDSFFASGGKGLNITLPHKGSAAAAVQQLTPRATLAGAVNTIWMQATGVLVGDNTDGVGLLSDLTHNLGMTLKGRRILLVGAGGAARGVVAPLLEQAPASLVISNRTASRAQSLVALFEHLGPVSARSFSALGDTAFDLVINATAASLTDEVPAIPRQAISPATVCYDMAYGKGDTPFTLFCKVHGARATHTGLGMLVEQAAESFFLWRGIKPKTATVLRELQSLTRAS